MGKSITKGNATIEIDKDMQDVFLGFLDKVIPEAKKIMDTELARIEQEAQKDWPRRKPQIRKDSMGKIVFFRELSKESWKMFSRGVRVDAQGNIVVFLKNRAPYSWVIKFGEDSENKDGRDIIQPQGKRAAQELLIKPQRKTINKVVKALADDLAKRI